MKGRCVNMKPYWKHQFESERDWDGGHTNHSWYECSNCGHIEKYSTKDICPSCNSYMRYHTTLTVGELKAILKKFNDNDKVCIADNNHNFSVEATTTIDKSFIKQYFGDDCMGILLNIKSEIK